MKDQERPGKTPRYVEILNVLRTEIGEGTFPVGGLLSSEAILCARFKVSRFTVREALRYLQADGMVKRTQGAGSRILRDTPTGVFVQSYRSVSDLTQYAAETEFDLLKIEETVLDADLAGRIGQVAGEVWLLMRGLRRTPANTPLSLVESYVPLRFKDIAPDLARGAGPIYAGLADGAGEKIKRVDQDTQALPAPYHVAAALGLAEGAPSLLILRRYASASGLLIASFNWHHSGERYVHRTQIMLDEE
jgi:GntR family transcriptional regulator